MLLLKACIVCLRTNGRLFEMDSKGSTLRRDYNLLSGLMTAKGNGMPCQVCFECAALLKKFSSFRSKCHRSHFALQEMLKRTKEITMHNIKSIDRKAIDTMPLLSFFDPKKYHYSELKFQWSQKMLRNSPPNVEMPLVSYSIGFVMERLEYSIEAPTQARIKMEIENQDEKFDNQDDASLLVPMQESQNVYVNEEHAGDYDDDYLDNDNYENENDGTVELIEPKEENDVDGLVLDLEYAMLIPLSKKEARAAFRVSTMFYKGNYKCEKCNISLPSEDKLKTHSRMHDRHFSGNFVCETCDNHYKTAFLLQTHHADKHAYKYVCQKCSEVSFDRRSAKHHYVNAHGEVDRKGKLVRPDWLPTKRKGFNKKKSQYKTIRKRLGSDFPKRTAVPQLEQYRMVQDRKNTRNYKESPYKCEFCFKGFRETATYEMHMKKHDPAISGRLQCDMCKMRAQDARGMYRHVCLSHLFKYKCGLCEYECFSRGQATSHYHSHQNVTYSCPHCPQVFNKLTTKMTHVRIKHPSNHICTICGHTFVSEAGLYFHKRKTHTPEDIAASSLLPPEPAGGEGEGGAGGAGGGDALYCAECRVQFLNPEAYSTHLGSSGKHANINWSCKISGAEAAKRKRLSYKGAAAPSAAGGAGAGAGGADSKRRRRARAASEILHNGQATESPCEVCGLVLKNDVQTMRHYRDAHPGIEVPKRYMCDQCGHKTKQYANLVSHMRVHTNEKPYSCPHCDRKFSMPSNRDRHLVVHTGEKPYECKLCFRRFSQSTAVKLHVQTVHLKIPYKPWDKKNRKRRKEMESQMPATEPKLLLDTTENYINAYISYNE